MLGVVSVGRVALSLESQRLGITRGRFSLDHNSISLRADSAASGTVPNGGRQINDGWILV